MEWRKLLLNAGLAGLWAALAAFTATGELTTSALYAAGAIGLRTAVGYLSAWLGKPVPVDQ